MTDFPTPGAIRRRALKECGLSSIPSTQNRDCPTNLKRLHDTRGERESQPRRADFALFFIQFCKSHAVFIAKGGHFWKRH